MTANWPIPGGYCRITKDRCSRHGGRDLFEQFQPFRAQIVFVQHEAGNVSARPRETIDIAGPDWIGDTHEYDRHNARCLQQRHKTRDASSQDDVGRKRDQFRRVFASLIGVANRPAIVNPHVSAVSPTQLLQRLQECRGPELRARIVPVAAALKHCDAPHPLGLLRAGGERPSDGGATGKSDELAPPHTCLPQPEDCTLPYRGRKYALCIAAKIGS